MPVPVPRARAAAGGQVLSGGQKQRLAWARLYYHKPAFGFVDEGTSAVRHVAAANRLGASVDWGLG